LDGTQDRPAGRRLAATTLTHQTQRFSFHDVKAHAIHGFDVAYGSLEKTALDGKVLFQFRDFEQRLVLAHLM
jgi:hypothetical protein